MFWTGKKNRIFPDADFSSVRTSGFTDKVIAKEDSERIKRWINMTQVGRLYEEEKQEALRELERKLNNENWKKIQNLKKEHRHTLQKSKQEQREILQKMEKESTLQNSRQIARCMLEKGMSVADIQSVIINLSYDEIEALRWYNPDLKHKKSLWEELMFWGINGIKQFYRGFFE